MKRANFLYKILLLFVIFFTITSCNNKKGAGIKIGLMWPYTTASRMKIETEQFKEKASQLGCEIFVTDAKNDEKLQREQAIDLINKGVDVLVIMAVNTYTAAEIVRLAHEKNIKVIAYDRLIKNCDVDFYISHNNYNVGKYMAEYALKLKPEGKYLLLGGDKSDNNAVFVKNGQRDALKQAVEQGKVKIVFDIFVDEWSYENAYHIMKYYLNLSSLDCPDVILSSYDGLTYGAIKALEETEINPANIIITGQDAEPKAIKYIIAGKQTMTIFKPLRILADKAVEVAVQLAKGKIPTATSTLNNKRINVPSILFDPIVVDKNNIKETVIKEGLIKETDIY
jgi:D-xylose transport system substrate-binding protein